MSLMYGDKSFHATSSVPPVCVDFRVHIFFTNSLGYDMDNGCFIDDEP